MWNFFKRWVGAPLAAITIAANAIRAPQNLSVIMNWLPAWVAEDWLRTGSSLFAALYLLYIGMPLYARWRGKLNFTCDFPTLEKLCQLLPHMRDDAKGYFPFQPAMMKRLGELDSYKAVFAASGLTNEYARFWNHVAEAIDLKRTYLSPANRQEFQCLIDQYYPLLKKALDDDYAQRRTERR